MKNYFLYFKSGFVARIKAENDVKAINIAFAYYNTEMAIALCRGGVIRIFDKEAWEDWK